LINDQANTSIKSDDASCNDDSCGCVVVAVVARARRRSIGGWLGVIVVKLKPRTLNQRECTTLVDTRAPQQDFRKSSLRRFVHVSSQIEEPEDRVCVEEEEKVVVEVVAGDEGGFPVLGSEQLSCSTFPTQLQ